MYNEKHPQADGSNFEVHSKFFWTPFWSNSIPEWVDKIDKACQVHLDWAHERESSKVEKLGSDFGMVYHSGPIELNIGRRSTTVIVSCGSFMRTSKISI